MRIVVMSDSHKNVYNVMQVLKRQQQADVFIHLGDGALNDIDPMHPLLKNKMLLRVSGNCDFTSLLPYEETRSFDNVKIFMTHGHRYYVKSSMNLLEQKARQEKADIALYGHTHEAKIEYNDGLYLFCPGSVGGGYTGATYGTVDITKAGIVCNVIKL